MSKKKHDNRQSPGNTPDPKAATAKAKPARALPWHPAIRALISLLVCLHLLAVFVAPWNLSTPPALPPGYDTATDRNGRPLPPPREDDPVWQQPRIIRGLAWFFHHYQNLVNINHGYEFFAPDPAGTHLIRYRITKPDGTVVKGHFPDLKEQWPRLYYHRHMMLAEQTASMGEASGRHYAEHLAQLYGGRAHLDWVVHLLLTPEQVREGRKLDDKSTYQVLASVDATAPLDQEPIHQGDSVVIPGGAR